MEKNSRLSRSNQENALAEASQTRAFMENSMRGLRLTGNDKRKIELIANYFPIEVSTGLIFHYDIDISKIMAGRSDGGAEANAYTHKKYKCLNTKIKRNVVETIVATKLEGIRPAFDGEKNLYSNKPLPRILAQAFNVTLEENGRSVTYEINLKPVYKKENVGNLPKNSISFEPLNQLIEGRTNSVTEEIQTAIMALETIIRHGPAQHLIPIGRSFYTKPHEDRCYISGGLEIWFGHYQCVQITKRKLMLNIDFSTTAFYRNCNVIDFMLDILYPDARDKEETLRRIRRITPPQQNILLKQLKNVNIQVTHMQQNRKHRIIGITPDSANETFFERDINGEKTTSSIAEYFRSQYEALKYPNLPCLDVSTRDKVCYLPIEVCEIVEGQHYNKKLSEKQTAEMIQVTAQPPVERFKEIQNSLEVILQDFDIFSREFGIRINPNPVRLVGKVLNPPVITYCADEVQPSNGRWNMRGQQFLEGVNVDEWMILNFSQKCNRSTLENFAKMLISEGRNVGLKFSPQPMIKNVVSCNDAPGDIIKKEKETHPKLQLIIIVLPTEKSQNIYCEVKTVAETDLGIMTQCVKDANILGKKCSSQLICNICQKINAKMGGVNNTLFLEENLEDVMIIGADCCHPSPGEDNEYSIAALVGNLDHFSGRYKASVRAQKPAVVNRIKSGREIIIEIKEMMKELLIVYRENNHGVKPKKVIFYRDGVSEGEFEKVLEYELRQIREAFEEVCGRGGNEIPVTFIVVRKRHHTRFNVLNRSDGVGKYVNIPPGTVVDTDIVYPIFGDFFLCSQLGIQGTSQPAHYTVINDDNNFSLDEIQSLTYNLCHTSVRSTTSTTVPSPVMYASLAASRVKNYVITKGIEICNSTDEEHRVIIEESIREAISVVDNMENSMYFV